MTIFQKKLTSISIEFGNIHFKEATKHSKVVRNSSQLGVGVFKGDSGQCVVSEKRERDRWKGPSWHPNKMML